MMTRVNAFWELRIKRLTLATKYLPELDGIRAIAVLMVICFHLNGYIVEKFKYSDGTMGLGQWFRLCGSGWVGVEIFFVLSGFVLFLPFAESASAGGKAVDLRRFYIRRIIRIWPPYAIAMTIAYFGVLFLGANDGRSVSFLNYLATLTYCHNWLFEHPSRIVVVAWTLEVEVQFYLLAPLFAMLYRLRPWVRRFVVVSILILSAVKNELYGVGDVVDLSDFLGYFLIGFLWADFYASGKLRCKSFWFDLVAVVGFAGVIVSASFQSSASFFLLLPVAMTAIGLANGFVAYRLLATKPFMLIGVSCYTGYLLHYPIISVVGRFFHVFGAGQDAVWMYWIYFSSILVVCYIFIIIYYVVIERYFMDVKLTQVILDRMRDRTRSDGFAG
jgi:peptidoglycan/LPS O-acetylase OafA/YrhL